MTFDRENMKRAAAALAKQGVYIGTSSWKYTGWRGQLYDESRYEWHGKFSEARFERSCLTEYAEVFKSVCVDAAYYKFPDQRYLNSLVSQVPEDFQYAFKVTDQITIKKFTNLPRFGLRAGKPNEDFLNAELFESAFLKPCKPFQKNVGLLIFEFSRFYPSDFARGRDFVAALDGFLSRLPAGWRYGVEIRNPNFLQPDYFSALAARKVAHVFNSWQGMPPVEAQRVLPGSLTNPDIFSARFLLRPGRKYEDAVKLFTPYDSVKDEYPEARAAGTKIIEEAKARGGAARAFIYVNNRLEGNALQTIAAMVEPRA